MPRCAGSGRATGGWSRTGRPDPVTYTANGPTGPAWLAIGVKGVYGVAEETQKLRLVFVHPAKAPG